jgi:flagellar basal-body rod protein FlgB
MSLSVTIDVPAGIAAVTMRQPAAADGALGGIFGLAAEKISWLAERQQVLSENIANADTPSYMPRDVTPFAPSGGGRVVLAQTVPGHLAAPAALSEISVVPRSRAPDGNAVGLESQMTEVADDETGGLLAGNLWKSYMGLYLTALGRGG